MDALRCRTQTVRAVNSIQFIQFNLFIKQKDRSATYTDMREIHVETL